MAQGLVFQIHSRGNVSIKNMHYNIPSKLEEPELSIFVATFWIGLKG